MKTKSVHLSRSDFRKSPDCNFFEDVLYSIGIPENEWEDIDIITLEVESYSL